MTANFTLQFSHWENRVLATNKKEKSVKDDKNQIGILLGWLEGHLALPCCTDTQPLHNVLAIIWKWASLSSKEITERRSRISGNISILWRLVKSEVSLMQEFELVRLTAYTCTEWLKLNSEQRNKTNHQAAIRKGKKRNCSSEWKRWIPARPTYGYFVPVIDKLQLS